MKRIAFALALLVPALALAQPRGAVAADVVEVVVTVTKVDPKARTVTVRGPRGNLQTLAARLPELADRVAQADSRRSRAAVRATTPDRLPLCGEVEGLPGLHLLTGLGSRGFCVAPLLGEHLAAAILERPSPLPAETARRLNPRRHAPQPKTGADVDGKGSSSGAV